MKNVCTILFVILCLLPVGCGDSTPNEPPVAVSRQILQVVEGTNIHTDIGTIEASDPDGDALLFQVVGGHGLFSVDPETGSVILLYPMDYEILNAYELTVSISDGKLSTDVALRIEVLDRQGARITGYFEGFSAPTDDFDLGVCLGPDQQPNRWGVSGFFYAISASETVSTLSRDDFNLEISSPGQYTFDYTYLHPDTPLSEYTIPDGSGPWVDVLPVIEVTENDIIEGRIFDIGKYCFQIYPKLDEL